MAEKISLNVRGDTVIPTVEIIQGIKVDIANLEERIVRYNHGTGCTNIREFFKSRNKGHIPEKIIMEDLTLMGLTSLASDTGRAYVEQVYLQNA